jgi:hypothetical protein
MFLLCAFSVLSYQAYPFDPFDQLGLLQDPFHLWHSYYMEILGAVAVNRQSLHDRKTPKKKSGIKGCTDRHHPLLHRAPYQLKIEDMQSDDSDLPSETRW